MHPLVVMEVGCSRVGISGERAVPAVVSTKLIYGLLTRKHERWDFLLDEQSVFNAFGIMTGLLSITTASFVSVSGQSERSAIALLLAFWPYPFMYCIQSSEVQTGHVSLVTVS